jgi:uncharacterized protein DUF6174
MQSRTIKTSICVCVLLLILFTSACATINSSLEEVQPSPTWVATQNAQDEYPRALKRWQSHGISSYEISVDIFSSFVTPPCSMKGTITVQDNNLLTITEIETPMPIQMSNGEVIYNPECHEYQNYLVIEQFEVVEKLMTGQLPYHWNVQFDPEYGYVTKLTYANGGESVKDVSYFNFKPK